MITQVIGVVDIPPIFSRKFYENKGGMFSLIRCSKAYVDAAILGTVRFVEEGQSTYILVVGKCSMYLRRIHNHGLLFGRVSTQSYRFQVL